MQVTNSYNLAAVAKELVSLFLKLPCMTPFTSPQGEEVRNSIGVLAGLSACPCSGVTVTSNPSEEISERNGPHFLFYLMRGV